MINLIRLGDTTDHGGEVITASETMRYGGRCVARKGDEVSYPRHPDLLLEAAKKKELTVPFESDVDEKTAVVSISNNEIEGYQTTRNGRVKTVKVAGEEITRAGRLNGDLTGFLAEDMYWTDTFDNDHDK